MHSLERKLGFDIVRETILGKCATEGARRMTEEAAVMSNAEEIVQALKLTDEMRLVCMFEDTFPSEGYVDMRPFLMPLTGELSCISLANLILLQRGLSTIRKVVAFLKGSSGVYPSLKQLCEPVVLYPEILRKIDTIINKNGEVRDSASPELARIRAELKAKEKSISRTIAAVLKRAQADGIAASDAEVVVRDGKMLIPVNSSDKRKLQGIVSGRYTSLARETGIPRLATGRKDGGGSDTGLQQYRIDIGLLKLIEDIGQFLFLTLDVIRAVSIDMWPVDASDGGEPYGTYFVFRSLRMQVNSHRKQQEKV